MPVPALSANDALGLDTENDDASNDAVDEEDGGAGPVALDPHSESRTAFPPPPEPTPPRDEPNPPDGSFDTDPPER